MHGTPPPVVTVGLPVFNGARYLPDTLDSLLNQDLPDVEFLIGDNGSDDATAAICADYARRDARVQVHRSQVNRGAAWNYNRLVALAQGRYFKWAGYDDLVDPDVLSLCVAALEEEPYAVLAYPRTLIIDGDGEVVRSHEDNLELRHRTSSRRVAALAQNVGLCNPCFGVIRTSVLRRTGLIRPYVSSDVTLLAELAAYGAFIEVPGPAFHRRVHAASSRQGRTTMAEVARWFDTSRTSVPRAPRLRLLAETAAALVRTDLPPASRVGAAAAFSCVYGIRRTRITAGAWRRQLTGVRIPPSEMIYVVEANARD